MGNNRVEIETYEYGRQLSFVSGSDPDKEKSPRQGYEGLSMIQEAYVRLKHDAEKHLPQHARYQIRMALPIRLSPDGKEFLYKMCWYLHPHFLRQDHWPEYEPSSYHDVSSTFDTQSGTYIVSSLIVYFPRDGTMSLRRLSEYADIPELE